MSTINALLESVPLPRFFRVRQHFDRPLLAHPEAELVAGLRKRGVLDVIRPDWQVAITVGSRGISNQTLLVRTLAREIRNRGANPFIVPAMGSHGGAKAAGQQKLLEQMGFCEESVLAPIRSSMETETIGTTEAGLDVCIDRAALKADGIILLNRIKPHTSFRGPIESGLLKMVAIGLGKQRGADVCHDLGLEVMAENVLAIARIALDRINVLFGIGLIENAYHETCRVEILKKYEIEYREPELLEEARQLSPRLHFDRLEVLIIDQIGKEISGTGLDTNVVGRYHTGCGVGCTDIRRIVVLDLTDASHGNANGLGIADFTTRRVFEKFDFEQTYPNSLTSTVSVSVKIPMVLSNDRQAIQAAIKTSNILNKDRVRVVRVKNTLSLEEIEVSESLLDQIQQNQRLSLLSKSYPLPFDERGNLLRT